MLRGDIKSGLLAAGDVFVLPSESEGLSMVILEAMAAGLPVIVSKGCNFSVPPRIGCGLVVERDVDELADALSALLRLPKGRLRAMGLLGRDYVEQRYSWSAIAGQMVEVYEWILGGARPTRVEIA